MSLTQLIVRQWVERKVWVDEEDFPHEGLYNMFRQQWHRIHFFLPLRFPAHPFRAVERSTDTWADHNQEIIHGMWKRTATWALDQNCGELNTQTCYDCGGRGRHPFSLGPVCETFVAHKRMALETDSYARLKDPRLRYGLRTYAEAAITDWGLTRDGVWALRLRRLGDVQWIFFRSSSPDLWVKEGEQLSRSPSGWRREGPYEGVFFARGYH